MLQHGLFEDIAAGLRHARVVVACVSDQYIKSSNCLMEFRFACDVMHIPTILAVVGTKSKWKFSEVRLTNLINFLREAGISAHFC